ncbi:MAG: XdhC/CoxI family protein [Bryobacteraceae bacterium]
MDIFEELVRLRRQGRRCALATIIEAQGSIPSYLGARLLVRDDGTLAGTVGGGCLEAAVRTAAQEVIGTGKPKRLSFDLGQDGSYENGLICGGQVEIIVEPILPQPKLFVFGAGHISKSLSQAAVIAGFETVIIDDRESFANRERFPEAAEIHAGEYEAIFPGLTINDSSFLVIVTRGHRDDLRVLRLAVNAPARYVAMVGSRRKVLTIFQELEKEGVPREAIEKVYAPMGLELGAVTPGEIAISVVAEMIAVLRDAPSGWRSLSKSLSTGARIGATLK